jgi:hypothetical protein
MTNEDYVALQSRIQLDIDRVSKLYAATRAKKSQKAEIKDLNAKIAAIEAERNQ